MENLTVVVVGVNRDLEAPELAESLQVACAKEGKLYLLGGKVFLDEDSLSRAAWLRWADENLLCEEGQTLWVDPYEEGQLVEITAKKLSLKEGEALQYNNSLSEWLYVSSGIIGAIKEAFLLRVSSVGPLDPTKIQSLEIH